jgi:hypothetical protein
MTSVGVIGRSVSVETAAGLAGNAKSRANRAELLECCLIVVPGFQAGGAASRNARSRFSLIMAGGPLVNVFFRH